MGDKLTTEDLTGRNVQTEDRETQTEDRNFETEDRNFQTEDPERRDDVAATPAAAVTADAVDEPLLGSEDTARFERRWHQVQVAFVDEPRSAVEQADNLVAELMRQLAETFADERGRLETAWTAGEDVDTEQLRVALTRYRSFFQRLLAT
jgi:hypothetical protein